MNSKSPKIAAWGTVQLLVKFKGERPIRQFYLRGKTVQDLACDDAIYTRHIMGTVAESVTHVDALGDTLARTEAEGLADAIGYRYVCEVARFVAEIPNGSRLSRWVTAAKTRTPPPKR